ncbi:ABC transporter ATP-binding protein [Prevotella sp. OH937_COT-195]|uniref:ABC transporter ATP-binding protein n=1 Tax=Prevotella sp. OH937_COT-195 TaxID=2491051 RepID=UPI000F6550B8|nr:ABC transporter ATP-binding protein [Prevotella sp. OH937_COT-195]RRD02717.1 ABC transporter ATP-binding protein [Prevotella sp. OH937_COT-195]
MKENNIAKPSVIVQTQNLCKVFRNGLSEIKAADHVNINLRQGEFSAIVGPSGSGKTTLLNLIGGLTLPSSGKILVNGKDIGTLKDKDLVDFRLHNIGFVFQSFNLIPVLTVEENISFIMELQGIEKNKRKQRTNELLELIGLKDRAKSHPATLSGGQKQRVAVARALASKPLFVLADEPTASLDVKAAGKLLDTMQLLNEQEHITFLFSTHDPRVMERARRIITIEDGRIIKDE